MHAKDLGKVAKLHIYSRSIQCFPVLHNSLCRVASTGGCVARTSVGIEGVVVRSRPVAEALQVWTNRLVHWLTVHVPVVVPCTTFHTLT